MKKIKLFIFISGLMSVLLLGFPASAQAKTNCREIARDIQSDASITNTKDPTGYAAVKVFTDAEAAYPECKKEIGELYTWNFERKPGVLFPFPKSGDPMSYPLGPVSWWWDVIYNKLFGGNTLLMFLFGWEIFLMPIPLIFMVILTPIILLKEIFTRKNKPKDV